MKETLIKAAEKAKENAYVPYSKFKVGAAVMASSGNVYTGCNIENASFSLTCCAERTAIFKAISEGEHHFKAMAVTANSDSAVSPCGACRQVMSEFFTPDVTIYLTNEKNDLKEVTVNDLLPYSFSL